jgi:hypothetical protein
LYLAAGAIAAILPGLLRLARFDGVEEVVEGASYLQARSAVSDPEPESRRRDPGNDAQEKERALHPGENKQYGQRGPEDAGE